MELCNYSNVFGKPGTGLHSYRVFDLAVVDILLTVVLAAVITSVLPKKSVLNFLIVLVLCFSLGIFLHRIFCVRTTVDKLLFPDIS